MCKFVYPDDPLATEFAREIRAHLISGGELWISPRADLMDPDDPESFDHATDLLISRKPYPPRASSGSMQYTYMRGREWLSRYREHQLKLRLAEKIAA